MASELRVDRIIPVNGVPTGGGGGIVQMVQNSLYGSTVSTTSTSYQASGLITTITPRKPNSKFYLSLTNGRYIVQNADGMAVAMYVSENGGSYTKALSGNRGETLMYLNGATGGEFQAQHSLSFLYTPSTSITSTIAFQPYFKSFDGGSVRFNEYDANGYGEVFLTVMEVSG